jgi:hypothetical protein
MGRAAGKEPGLKSVLLHAGLAILAGLLLFTSAPHESAKAQSIITAVMGKIDLPTNDLVWDSGTQKIYASVTGGGGARGNTITPIDPLTGTLGSSVFIGSEPNKLARSDSGAYLYAGLDGAAGVRRFDIATQTAGLQFSLGSDSFFGPYYVEDLAVLPGTSDSIAVSLKNLGVSPRHAGVAVYDSGVQRPTATPRHTGSNVIEAASSTTLYGLNNETTEYGFRRMAVAPSGVTVTDVTGSLVNTFGIDIAYQAGKVYFTDGKVADPTGPTVALLGTYAGAFGPVAPDTANNRVYFLTTDPSNPANSLLRIYNMTTFASMGGFTLTGITGGSHLITWGNSGIAFRTATQVIVMQFAQSVDWQQVPGAALDIGAGSDGSAWVIGSDNGIYHFNGSSWDKVPGSAVKIATAPDGTAWVINSVSSIYHLVNGFFAQVPGAAQDIAVGANGAVWVTGAGPGNAGIYHYNGVGWDQQPGSAVRIAVGPDGQPWVINSQGGIYRSLGGGFVNYAGVASDIGIANDGNAWITGPSPGFGIYHTVLGTFQPAGGSAQFISAGANVWVITANGQIYRSPNGQTARAADRPFFGKEVLVGSNLPVGTTAGGSAPQPKVIETVPVAATPKPLVGAGTPGLAPTQAPAKR